TLNLAPDSLLPLMHAVPLPLPLFLLILPPPPTSTLFPYTTLFRSRIHSAAVELCVRHSRHHGGAHHPLLARPPRDHHDREAVARSEEHTSELQSLAYLVCRLLLEKKKKANNRLHPPITRVTTTGTT